MICFAVPMMMQYQFDEAKTTWLDMHSYLPALSSLILHFHSTLVPFHLFKSYSPIQASKKQCLNCTWISWEKTIFLNPKIKLHNFQEKILKYKLVTSRIFGTTQHDSQSRYRPPTRRALRRIGLGDSDRYRAIRAKRYIESSKNSEKITTNLKKM